jgi:ferredoxin
VTGNGSGSSGPVYFNPSNPTIAPGQTVAVSLSGGSSGYYVTGNSNSNVATQFTNGNTMTVQGLQGGTTAFTVCANSVSGCSTLTVTVTGSTSSSSSSGGQVTFSVTNPTLGIGQNSTVTLSGGSSYTISTPPDSGILQATISGSILTLYPLSSGSTSLVVCASGGGCSTLPVIVGSGGSGQQQVTFGVTNPTITVGQTSNISLSGGTGYFVSSNSNSGILQASASGSTLSLYGLSAGSSSVTVCMSAGGCGTLTVTVVGAGQTTTVTQTQTTTQTSQTSQASLLAAIQSMQTQLAQLLAQIQAMASSLNQLAAIAGVSTVSNTTGNNASANASSHSFTQYLSVGSTGGEVSALQQFLSDKGFYSGSVTGTYGSLTESAVKAFQSAHGISPLGFVGPSTRAALNGY